MTSLVQLSFAAATSQGAPAPATSPPATIPALTLGIQTLLLPGTGSLTDSTRTVVVSVGSTTTVILGSPLAVTQVSIPSTSSLATGVSSARFGTISSTSSGPTSSATGSSNTSGGSSTNVGAIAGGVVGGLAVLGIVVVAMYYIRRRHPKPANAEAPAEGKMDFKDEYKGELSGNPVSELEAGMRPEVQELDGGWNQINELPVVKK